MKKLTSFVLTLCFAFSITSFSYAQAVKESAKPVTPAAITPAVPAANMNESQKELKDQVEALQGDILSDEDIMKSIETLLKDEEITKILADKDFMQDILSFDEKKIEANTKMNSLLQNPKMQELIKLIEMKFKNDNAGEEGVPEQPVTEKPKAATK